MKAYQITAHTGLDALKLIDLPKPTPGPRDVLIRMRANSMNYRDLAMPSGGYHRNRKVPLIPLSDGAGEVAEIGSQVKRFKPGDQVMGCFFQRWPAGELTEEISRSALGGAIDGMLAEYVALNEEGCIAIPQGLSYEEAACLPCAALTAWQALIAADTRPGQTVLTLGTGGVSIFALQFAKTFGCRVMITSSRDDKLDRAIALGADETINYVETPDWNDRARELTAGVGVDHVIEVGGAGTLERSLAATRVSGTVSLIGVLAGNKSGNPSPMPALFNRITIRGIHVGSRERFEQMNRAIEVNGIRPIIDRAFPFGEARAAYEHLRSGRHFGKIVIAHGN